MTWLDSINDPDAIFVLDTSVLINLSATERMADIFGGLFCQFALSDHVRHELERGKERGHRDMEIVEDLLQQGHLVQISLGEKGKNIYEDLIFEPTKVTLGKGESATIGCAVERSGVALIDERKAT